MRFKKQILISFVCVLGFWASKSYLVHTSKLFLCTLVGRAQAFGSGETVRSRLQELKHWERHQTVRADHTGRAGSTKFRSFKILPLCSAAGLLTEVKKPWKRSEFQIDCILLKPSTNSVALHLPPTIGPKEWEERCHFPPQFYPENRYQGSVNEILADPCQEKQQEEKSVLVDRGVAAVTWHDWANSARRSGCCWEKIFLAPRKEGENPLVGWSCTICDTCIQCWARGIIGSEIVQQNMRHLPRDKEV